SKYDDSIKKFDDYLQNFSIDPEARIYLNNARAGNSKNFLKIAACMPIYSSKVNRDIRDSNAEQLLRGVAVVQEEINSQKSLVRPIQDKMLFIEICNDRDNEGEAEAVANRIVKQKDILGVIGHYSSNTTLASGKVYGFNKIVAISPTSTAIRDNKFLLSPYVFRVAPDNSIFAEKLISHIPANLTNIAIFYVENSTYSQSLRQEFKKQITLGIAV
ncbi:MAG: amino acid ABC transporter substrate-binding protein, partial [Nostocaceae cyanobacterium]|nr:amino acid ABC transporter substrate-binding protein [Nostocaceae cyanobacterium]